MQYSHSILIEALNRLTSKPVNFIEENVMFITCEINHIRYLLIESLAFEIEYYLVEESMIREFVFPATEYTKNDFIGIADSYSINYGYLVVNFSILNERFNALKNIDTFPLSMPLIDGTIENSVVVVKNIQAIVIMM